MTTRRLDALTAIGAVETACAFVLDWQALFALGVSTAVYASARRLEAENDGADRAPDC